MINLFPLREHLRKEEKYWTREKISSWAKEVEPAIVGYKPAGAVAAVDAVAASTKNKRATVSNDQELCTKLKNAHIGSTRF